MESGAIRSLRANVTRDEAIRMFLAPGPAFLYWKWRSGPLRNFQYSEAEPGARNMRIASSRVTLARKLRIAPVCILSTRS